MTRLGLRPDARSAALVTLVAAGCATVSPDLARVDKHVRELQDQVYLLRKEREDLEARVARLEGRAPAPRPAAVGPTMVGPTAVTPASPRRDPVRAVAGEHPADVTPAARSGTADEAFERARRLHDETRFAAAIPVLQDFVERFPADARAPQAQYLIGECHYAEANFPQAIVEFGKVAERWADGPQAPEALYKIGLSYYELGYERNALEHLERLLKGYPGSKAAAAAEPLLEKLRKRRDRR